MMVLECMDIVLIIVGILLVFALSILALKIAIKATNTLSTETFEEFDRYKDEEKQREEEEMQKDVDS